MHKTPHYVPASIRLSHSLQVCYWMLILRRRTRTHCKSEIPSSLSMSRVTTSFWSSCALCVDMCWQCLTIHHLLKCPTLPFGPSCNFRNGQVILLYSNAPTIHKVVAQIHRAVHIYQTVQIPQQCSVTSYGFSRRLISTASNKFDVEEHAVRVTWLSFILHDFAWVNSLTSGLPQTYCWRRITDWRLLMFRSNALQLYSRVKQKV